tara:strand:- start:453 stop:650 length:198 start_codon:yes stop_codon:yes gene_type:complete
VAVAVDNVEIGKILGDVNMAIIADSFMIAVLQVEGDVITTTVEIMEVDTARIGTIDAARRIRCIF